MLTVTLVLEVVAVILILVSVLDDFVVEVVSGVSVTVTLVCVLLVNVLTVEDVQVVDVQVGVAVAVRPNGGIVAVAVSL